MGWTIVIVAAGCGALAGMLYQAFGATRDRRMYVAPGELGLAGGHRLHYRCAGTGTPAVVLEAGIADVRAPQLDGVEDGGTSVRVLKAKLEFADQTSVIHDGTV
jgi:hypothetical protein